MCMWTENHINALFHTLKHTACSKPAGIVRAGSSQSLSIYPSMQPAQTRRGHSSLWRTRCQCQGRAPPPAPPALRCTSHVLLGVDKKQMRFQGSLQNFNQECRFYNVHFYFIHFVQCTFLLFYISALCFFSYSLFSVFDFTWNSLSSGFPTIHPFSELSKCRCYKLRGLSLSNTVMLTYNFMCESSACHLLNSVKKKLTFKRFWAGANHSSVANMTYDKRLQISQTFITDTH